MKLLLPSITILIAICTSVGNAQQSYIGNPESACYTNNSDNAARIYLGYDCNGPISCGRTSLTIRSQYPYNTLSAIGSLLSVNPRDIAWANPSYDNYNYNEVVEWDKLLYIPISCSCDSNNPYYVTFTSDIVGQGESSYFSLVNNTFQGLATRQGIQVMNPGNSLLIGNNITIPLRCACATNDQLSNGITLVFSYVVGEGDTITSISFKLDVDSQLILEANKLWKYSVIYPFTTLLIPVMDNQSTSPTIGCKGTTLSKATIGCIIAAAAAVQLGLGAVVRFYCHGTLNCCSTNLVYRSK